MADCEGVEVAIDDSDDDSGGGGAGAVRTRVSEKGASDNSGA